MSIPFAERRKLRAIEKAITKAEPALADRFTMFAARSWGQDMPHTEDLSARKIRRMGRSERWLALWLGN